MNLLHCTTRCSTTPISGLAVGVLRLLNNGRGCLSLRDPNIRGISVKDNSDLLESLALRLEEPTVGDETLDGEDDDVDEVVLPANVLQSDRLFTWSQRLQDKYRDSGELTLTYWLTKTAILVEKT